MKNYRLKLRSKEGQFSWMAWLSTMADEDNYFTIRIKAGHRKFLGF
jgi:hypothetical protein